MSILQRVQKLLYVALSHGGAIVSLTLVCGGSALCADIPDAEAEYDLGVKCSNGNGVKKDPILAYAWLQRAVEDGYTFAVTARWDLSQSMTQAQIVAAKEGSEQLRNKPITTNTTITVIVARESKPTIEPNENANWATVEAAMAAKYPWTTVNEIHRYNTTPLHVAMGLDEAVVRLLLANKANVNVRDDAGRTPLHFAAQYQRKDLVKLLLAHGADVNAEDEGGWTPLCWAAEQGDVDLVKLLIANNAEVNTKYGLTPLHHAVRKGHKDVAEILLDHGANVNLKDQDGNTAFHFAMGNQDMATMLLRHKVEINIHEAAETGDVERIKVLLSNSPELVSCRNKDDMTPLHCAASSGRKDAVELLLKNNADIDAKAVAAGRYFIYLKPTASVASITGNVAASPWSLANFTPLQMAAAEGRRDVVELLLAKGANVNARCSFLQIGYKMEGGETALSLARSYQHMDIVNLLRQHGGIE